jgi:hypothetical protein
MPASHAWLMRKSIALDLHNRKSTPPLSGNRRLIEGGGSPKAAQPPSPALLAGQYALRALKSNGFMGQVLSTFSRSFYILGPRGQILWVALPASTLHRRALLARFEPRAVRAHARVEVRSGLLTVEGITSIAFSRTAIWTPEPIKRSQITPIKALPASLHERLVWISELPGRRGLGHAIGLLMESRPVLPLHEMEARDRAFWEAAKGALIRVVQASREDNFPKVLHEGARLLGFGLGLTPSGDDYIGSLLFAAHHLAKAYPGDLINNPEEIRALLALSRSATNRISRAIFADLVHGHGPQPLHELLSAVLRGESRARVELSAKRLTQIGHSSGWDMLAGAATGLLLLSKRENG